MNEKNINTEKTYFGFPALILGIYTIRADSENRDDKFAIT